MDYDEEGHDFFEDGNLAEMQDVPVVDPEQFDFCDETVVKSAMNEHLLKKHDINLTEDSEQAPVKPSALTLSPVFQVSTPVAVLPLHISHYHAGICVMKDGDNTSLAAQGALAHRLQRRPRPIHKNAKSGAHPCSLPLGFNMAGWDLGRGVKNKTKIQNSLQVS